MAKPDRRITVRLSDAEAALIDEVRAAHPHLTKSEVVHLALEDNRETIAAALRAVPVASQPPVKLDASSLATLDGVASGLNDVGRELRPLRALANQMARASNSGDPLVAGQLARLAEAIEGCLDAMNGVASEVNGVASWRS